MENTSSANTAFLPGSAAKSLLDGMSEVDINAMSNEDFTDALFAQMRERQPLIDCDGMDFIEAEWDAQRRNRRAALVLLIKPFTWLEQKVIEDRDFAVAVAEVEAFAIKTNGFYSMIAELMKFTEWQAKLALCGRHDMDEIRAEAASTLGSGGEA